MAGDEPRELLEAIASKLLSEEESLRLLREMLESRKGTVTFAESRVGELFLKELSDGVAGFLKMDPGRLDPKKDLIDYGFDSIAASRLLLAFRQRYGINVGVEILARFRTIKEIADALMASHSAEISAHLNGVSGTPAPTVALRAAPQKPPSALSDIQGLWERAEARLVGGERLSKVEMPFFLFSFPGCGSMEIASYGNGPPLLLLGGLMSNAILWTKQFETWGKGHRVLALHPPGHGRSTLDPGCLSMERIVGSIFKILDALNIGSGIDVLGFSMGGTLALELALNRPERVRSLTLVNSSPRGGDSRFDYLRTHFTEVLGTTDPCVMRLVRDSMRDFNPEALALYADMLRRFDVTDRLKDIVAPALVVAGEEDSFIPIKNSVALNKGLIHSRLLIIKGAAHFPMLTHPQEFNDQVLAFLQSG